MQKYWNTVQDEHGNPRYGASVAVQQNGVNSTIYSDSAGTIPRTNPLTTDATRGYFEFYAAAGTYDLVIFGVGFSSYTITNGAQVGLPGGDVTYTPVSGTFAGIATTVQTWLDRLLTGAATTGAALIGFTQSGTGAVATTVQESLRQRKSVFNWMTGAQIADVIANTAAVDVTTPCQAAHDAAYDGGFDLEYPDGTYWITKSLMVWGGTDLYTSKGLSLIGQSSTKTIIKKTTNTGYGGVSAYANDDAIFVLARRDLTAGNSVALKSIHIANFNLNGDFGTGKTAFGIYNRCSLGASTFDSLVVSSAIGFQTATDFFLSRFTNTTFIVSTKGFSMLLAGTSNVLENIFVSGATSIAYELRGSYSTGNSLACDSCTGICYSFNGAAWTVNGLGSESTSATVVVQTASASWIVINGPFILPQNNVASKVFNVTGADTLIVNGGRVGSGSSPQALAGNFSTVASAASTFVANNLAVSDTYAVADSGPRMVSSSCKQGTVSVPTATVTTLYTLTGHEVGEFVCYASDNFTVFAKAVAGQAGGNPQMGTPEQASLTLTRVGAAIRVQHALGTTVSIFYKFSRYGESTT